MYGFQQPGFQPPGFRPGMIPPPHMQIQMQGAQFQVGYQAQGYQMNYQQGYQQQTYQQQSYQQSYQQQGYPPQQQQGYPPQQQQGYQNSGGFQNGYEGQYQPGNEDTSAQAVLCPETTYMISSGFNPDLVLGLDGQSIVLQESEESEKQLFRFRLVNGKYQIFSLKGLTMEIPEGSKKDGEQIIASDNNNTANEFWDIEVVPGSDDKYYFKSYCGKAMDIRDAMGVVGNIIVQTKFQGSQTQEWQLCEYGAYDQSDVAAPKILFPSTKKFTISMSEKPELSLQADGNTLILAQSQHIKSQQFTFRLINGRYQIFSHQRGVIEVPDSSREPGADLSVQKNDNDQNELWDIIPVSGNIYYIQSFCGLRMDPKNGIPLLNNDIVQSQPNQYQSQRWIIKMV